MDPRIRHWKVAIERFCTAPDPDYREIAKLVAEIAVTDIDETLRHAAAQVLPILRQAALKSADRRTRSMSLRRLGIVADALHTLSAPRFGRRGLTPKALTEEERHRQLLGLPFGPPARRDRSPSGVQARRQDGASRRRRQRRGVPRARRRARCLDQASLMLDRVASDGTRRTTRCCGVTSLRVVGDRLERDESWLNRLGSVSVHLSPPGRGRIAPGDAKHRPVQSG